jgi:hypothetical protein
MWVLGQHILLGIVVGLSEALASTLYWALLLDYARFWTTHFTGHHSFSNRLKIIFF